MTFTYLVLALLFHISVDHLSSSGLVLSPIFFLNPEMLRLILTNSSMTMPEAEQMPVKNAVAQPDICKGASHQEVP